MPRFGVDEKAFRFEEVFKRKLETAKAWAYKGILRDLRVLDDEQAATEYFRYWHNRVIRTKRNPLKKVAKTIKERLANVVSYCTHGVTVTAQ
jgi:hypothetical protein